MPRADPVRPAGHAGRADAVPSEPCAELIRDDRKDATVDLAIGKDFDDLRPNADAKSVMKQLTDWAKDHPKAKGGLQADGPQPKLDGALLTGARSTSC